MASSSILKAVSSPSTVRQPPSSTAQKLSSFASFSQQQLLPQPLGLSAVAGKSTKSFSCKAQAETSDSKSTKVQKLHVYEINERDRGSPAYLRLSQKTVNSLGDLVPFSNKVYTGDLKKRAGITAGICILIKNEPEKKGDRYEAIYSFYLGDYGHIAVQGPYLTYEDTDLAVTGGSGIFEGVSGHVRLHQIIFPFKLFYTFHLKGIDVLPAELLGEPVAPAVEVVPADAAKNCEEGATLAGFND